MDGHCTPVAIALPSSSSGGASLLQRVKSEKIKEVILANSATVDGQTTAHYIADQLSSTDIILSRLAQGLPMGGELDFLDDGTITQALRARSKLQN